MPSEQQRVQELFQSMPGKRGIDIPAHAFDQIMPVANGITQQLWGRPPTMHQMQELYDNGLSSPAAIHAYFDGYPHPHAPNLSVGEYGAHSDALQLYNRVRGAHR